MKEPFRRINTAEGKEWLATEKISMPESKLERKELKKKKEMQLSGLGWGMVVVVVVSGGKGMGGGELNTLLLSDKCHGCVSIGPSLPR